MLQFFKFDGFKLSYFKTLPTIKQVSNPDFNSKDNKWLRISRQRYKTFKKFTI